MKTRLISTLCIFSLSGAICLAQVRITSDPDLEKQIIQTGILHSPLPLDNANSYEANGLKKKILYSEPVPSATISDWTPSGLAELTRSMEQTVSGKGSLRMGFPTQAGGRVKGPPGDPDYASYPGGGAELNLKGANWEKYNRIAFDIFPDCEGMRVVNVVFSYANEDTPTIKGTNRKTMNRHLVNLVNGQWNRCFLDIGEFQRDKVIKIGFSSGGRGKDRTTGDSAVYYIDKIELQQIEDPEIVSGWQPGDNRIVYSTSGYTMDAPKTAIVNMDKNKHKGLFQLLDAATGQSAFEGQIRREKTTIGDYDVLDFTLFNKPGTYQLKVGGVTTPTFRIGQDIWDNSLWRVTNYIFCQRCGYSVPGIHSTCHTDLCAVHNGEKISYAGGWHDAGDLSQQTLQTGDVTYALLEAYNNLKDKNQLLAYRMLEEAEWGLEFILKTRFGDGYRASSMGLLIWLDGIFNTFDDISSVRVQNMAYDNFLYAAYIAYAAMSMDRDPMLADYLHRIAKEDFAFGMQRHKEVGYGEFHHFYEHTYNTSKSLYMATISWSASMMYKLTKEPYYAEIAAEYIDYTLECQRKEPIGGKDGIKGFFYRDTDKKVIVHYNHQSREQIFMQAMTLLCETQPSHPKAKEWSNSITLYGDFLKGIMKYTAPYGMIPDGVYHVDEYKDEQSFFHLHLFPPDNAQELFSIQVKKGVQLDKEHYFKRFPAWFSIFSGNTAIHLASGKAAAICGKFLKDDTLMHIGREQLYWTVGKNPFGQSLIYGEGHNFTQLDSFSSGEIIGAMPVGIQTLGNEDIPYWPQTNTACYKEVWVTSAGKWISLLSEY